jgi:alpha-glucosidase
MPNGGKPVPPAPSLEYDEATAVDGTGLVFEDRYVQVGFCSFVLCVFIDELDLQLTTSLPLGTNIYGLGEVLASSGFRRDAGFDPGEENVRGGGTIQTNWARDIADPVDENV